MPQPSFFHRLERGLRKLFEMMCWCMIQRPIYLVDIIIELPLNGIENRIEGQHHRSRMSEWPNEDLHAQRISRLCGDSTLVPPDLQLASHEHRFQEQHDRSRLQEQHDRSRCLHWRNQDLQPSAIWGFEEIQSLSPFEFLSSEGFWADTFSTKTLQASWER